MMDFLKPIPIWVWVLLAALAGGYAGYRWERVATLQAITDLSTERASAATAAQAAGDRYRALEAQMQKGVDDAQELFDTAQAANRLDAGRAAVELGRLRRQLAAATASSGSTAPVAGAEPSVDGTPDGAAVLRYVVGQCADRYAAVAGEADALGARLTGLQNWARVVTAPP